MIRILAAGCLAAAIAAAESIPADCRWWASCDLQTLAATRSGAWIRDQLQRDQVTEQLAELETATGFDPRRDLRRIEVCAAADGESSGLLLLRGAFDGQRLDDVIQHAQDHVLIADDGRAIHTWRDHGAIAAGCVAAADLLILGRSAERIRQGLTALEAGTATPVALPAGWEASAIAVAAADGLDELAQRSQPLAMLRGLRSLAARLSESAGQLVLEVRAVAIGEDEARRYADLIQGGRAVLDLMPPAGLDRALLDSLRSGTLRRSGTQLDLRLALPVAEALRLAEQRIGHGPAPVQEPVPAPHF